MKICGIGKTLPFRSLGLALVLSIGTFVLGSGTTQADSWGSGGSWGGSGGGWSGSSGGGSSGGGGLFGGRRPIRNLIGRIHDRFHGGSHGSHGSTGSYSSFGSHGSVGSNYASHGSTGSSYASTGSSYASTGSIGSSYGSVGSSYGSTGSSYGSIGSGYGSVGSSNASYGAPAISAPSYPSYDSAPIYDSGYSSGVIHSGAIQNGGMIDGGSMQPVQGIYMEGSSQPSEYYNAPSPPSSGSTPANPGPAGGSTSIGNGDTTVLSLNVPADAKVFINDFKTRTEGESRRYVSRNLKPGQEYFYNVKAVVVRDGKEVVRNHVVAMKAGQTEMIAFDFETLETALTLEVPKDAKVTLCGKTTKASGKVRHFSTSGLEKGKTWNDYTVEVTIEKNGKTIRQEKKIDMVAGETYKLNFELDETGEMLAVR